MIIINVIFVVLATIAVALRFIARRMKRTSFFLEDYLILLALVCLPFHSIACLLCTLDLLAFFHPFRREVPSITPRGAHPLDTAAVGEGLTYLDAVCFLWGCCCSDHWRVLHYLELSTTRLWLMESQGYLSVVQHLIYGTWAPFMPKDSFECVDPSPFRSQQPGTTC